MNSEQVERPHMIDGRPASTEEIIPVVAQHVVHDGIAFFDNCPECLRKRDAGEYPHWFPVAP